MKMGKRSLGLTLAMFVVLGIGLFGGIVLDREMLVAYAAPSEAPTNPPFNFQLMTEAVNLVTRIYVDRSALEAKNLTYGAIRGMVEALGDTGHSTFLTPARVQQERDYNQGQFSGIGVEVDKRDDRIVIIAPMDNSPALKAGIRPGDIILKVDGNDIAGQSLDQVIEKIVGLEGTTVTLTILHNNSDQAQDITLTRARIELHNVTWKQLPGTTIAHLRLAGFSRGVTLELEKALKEIQQQGMTGIILDLRNNPGGLLSESIGTASEFLASGNVLEEKNAQGQVTAVPVRGGGVAAKIPLVVLINNGTASASEIVSGALEDAQRATLIGETTFGTGTVLNEFPLSDGSALLLATEEWLTPKGRAIWHHGITPEIVVTLPASATPLTPEVEAGLTQAQLRASGDKQLLRALDLLEPLVNNQLLERHARDE